MRTTFRASLKGEVRFKTLFPSGSEGISGVGMLQNASTGGLCFTTDMRLSPGARIELYINSNAAGIAVKGTVMHIRECGEGLDVGIRFDIDDPETEDALQMMLAMPEQE